MTKDNTIFLKSIFENDKQIVVNGNVKDYKAKVKKSLENFVLPQNENEVFNHLYNKNKGEFGHYIPYLTFKWFKHSYRLKNGRTYFYPNENCEGIGIRVNINEIGENIFDEDNDWCNAYCNLMKNRISYKINGIEGTIIRRIVNDEFKIIRIFFQCKVRKSQIIEDNEHNEIILNEIENNLIPYRLIREHMSK